MIRELEEKIKVGSIDIKATHYKLDEMKDEFNHSFNILSSRLKEEISSQKGPSLIEVEKLMCKKANLDEFLGL